MAQLSKPAIPANMYKHFAIITFAMTAILALFAGDSSEISGSTAPQTARSAQPRPSSRPTPAYGQAQFDTGGMEESSAGIESNVGMNFDYQRSIRGRGVIGEIGATSLPRAGSENAAFTREYLDSLSDEELEELLRQLRATGAEDPASRQQIMQVLENGSRRRSGGN